MGKRDLARAIIGAMLLALGMSGCGAAQLSDAERAWCPDHVWAVAAAADSLDLPAPQDTDSWDHWARLVDSGVLSDLWNSMTTERDRPNRDRACKAAYAAR